MAKIPDGFEVQIEEELRVVAEKVGSLKLLKLNHTDRYRRAITQLKGVANGKKTPGEFEKLTDLDALDLLVELGEAEDLLKEDTEGAFADVMGKAELMDEDGSAPEDISAILPRIRDEEAFMGGDPEMISLDDAVESGELPEDL